MLVKKIQSEEFTAEQFLPPASIPDCMVANQSVEGFWYAECNQGKSYLPGEWCLIDVDGNHWQYTNEQFLELFESVI